MDENGSPNPYGFTLCLEGLVLRCEMRYATFTLAFTYQGGHGVLRLRVGMLLAFIVLAVDYLTGNMSAFLPTLKQVLALLKKP